MSHTVNSATVAPTSASISTPVGPTEDASAATRIPRGEGVSSTRLAVSAIAWQCGISSGVRFIARSPASSPAAIGSPFSTAWPRTARRVPGDSAISPVATARRATDGLPPTSVCRAIRLPYVGRARSDVGEDGFELDPVGSALRQSEVDLAEVLEETDLLPGGEHVVRDVR